MTVSISNLIRADQNIPANVAVREKFWIFDNSWEIESISQESNAIITVTENACLEVGQKIYILGADTCPLRPSQEYTITTLVSPKSFRCNYDASIHGSGQIGLVGIIDENDTPVFDVSLHEPQYAVKNLSGSAGAVRVDDFTLLTGKIQTPINKARIGSTLYDVTGFTNEGGCGGTLIQLSNAIPESILGVSVWQNETTLELGEKTHTLAMENVDLYSWRFTIPALDPGQKILQITRYLGLQKSNFIRGVITAGT